MCFPAINAKFLRTFIQRLLKNYPVLLFWFLEDISEIAVCRPSTKSAYAEVPFQYGFPVKFSVNFLNKIVYLNL